MAKAATPTKPLTKTELLANIAAATELPKTQVAAVLEALAAEIQKSLSNKGAGAITIPGLVKIEKKKVPARKAEKGVPNPFKPGELMDRPAKPAYNKVKVRALEAAQGHGEVAANLRACKRPRSRNLNRGRFLFIDFRPRPEPASFG